MQWPTETSSIYTNLKLQYYARRRHAKYTDQWQYKWTDDHGLASATEDSREDHDDALATLNTMAG